MIKAICNQRIELSKEEWDYYLELEKSFGKDAFVGMFRTNKDGKIVSVMPSQKKPTAIILVFFLLNVMFNQRLRKFELWMKKFDIWTAKTKTLEERIKKLEKKLEDLNGGG